MWLRCSRWLVVLALTLSLGGHWALLQSVAWMGMVVAYSREGPIAEALNKTFDGKHPCCLCKMIQKGQAAEKKQPQNQSKPGSKLDVGITWKSVTLEFHQPFHTIFSSGDFQPVFRQEAPPKPPPRNLAANSFA